MPRAATLALACCALLAAAPAPASTDGSNMTTNKVTTIKRPADTATVRPARRVAELDDARAKAWLDLMLRAFPTVAAKDRLTGVHDGRGGVAFFHNGQPTASVADAEFARLFFGIWLAPQTSAPALRQALIGGGDDA